MHRSIVIARITLACQTFASQLKPSTSIIAIECTAGAETLRDRLIRNLQQHDGGEMISMPGFFDIMVSTAAELHQSARRQVGAAGLALACCGIAESDLQISRAKVDSIISALETQARQGDVESWFVVRDTAAVKSGTERLRLAATDSAPASRRALPPHKQQRGRGTVRSAPFEGD